MSGFEAIGAVFRKIAEQEERKEREALGMTAEEYRQHVEERTRAVREEIEAQAAREREREVNEESELGRKLGLGVRVRPAIAMRLSGLQMGSRNQNGAASNTVVHLYLLEPFERGRLKRESYRFLCRPAPFGFDVSSYGINEPITCPKCLELIARHGSEA